MRRHDSNIFLVLAYKNFAARQGISHIGLGVAAINTAKVLRKIGIRCEVLPAKDEHAIEEFLVAHKGVTHFSMSAPWIPVHVWHKLCAKFPEVKFDVVCHSNVGFLQADWNGIRNLKDDIELEMGVANFHVAANNERLVHFIENTYGRPCTYLPNLYFTNHLSAPHRGGQHKHGSLRIGIFGASRSLKNQVSAVGGALQISRELKAQTEIWLNSERDDGPETKTLRRAIEEMCRGFHHVTLKFAGWQSWSSFRALVGSMDLLLQPSYTESFNMVTADGIVEGVPSVVSPAIEWAPQSWHCEPDDVNSIARVGIMLLNDTHSAKHGFHALQKYNQKGTNSWVRYLMHNRFGDILDDDFEFTDVSGVLR